MNYLLLALFVAVLGRGQCGLPEEEETPTPAGPSHFMYKAGRYPGHVDRVHEESNDGAGRVQGYYSFVDPKHKVRTVEYTADKDGFHPTLINYDEVVAFPTDSEAVRLAKERHLRLYEKIANANEQGVPRKVPQDTASVERAKQRHFQLFDRIAQEHAAIAAQREAERAAFEATSVPNDVQPDHAY